MAVKRVAIIGAGSSGLPAIKSCLEEGLTPVCFEKTSDVGGLWNYRPEIDEEVSCVNLTTIANTGKETSAYSDFPMPEHFPNFLPHKLFQKYLELYADNFDLWRYIMFETSVVRVEKASDFEVSGKWNVTVKKKDGDLRTEIFDAVMLCSGHHAKPRIVHFEGEERFQGKMKHTHQYREGAWEYKDQRVVVIGMGDSALDAATTIAEYASQVFISTRRGGQWTFSRMMRNGLPWDMVIATRYYGYWWKWFPNYTQWYMEREVNRRFDHSLYGVKPHCRLTNQHPVISETLPLRLMSGSIKMKPEVTSLTETRVHFCDGSSEKNIDTIIYGTGYKIGFPYLDESVFKVEDNFLNLYRFVFPADLIHPTLAVIGCIQPNLSNCGIAEMQSRWATRVFKGAVKLPTRVAMQSDIKATAKAMAETFYASPRHTIQVDYIPYMDMIAKDVGCMPQIGKTLLTDPVLAYHLIFGPIVTAQYRLHGYGKWDKAGEIIKTVQKRVKKPLDCKTGPDFPDIVILFIGMLVLSLLFLLLYRLLFYHK